MAFCLGASSELHITLAVVNLHRGACFWDAESCLLALQRCPPEARPTDAPSTPAMPFKGSVRGDKGAAPSSPTANAASARNTAVAGEVTLSLLSF